MAVESFITISATGIKAPRIPGAPREPEAPTTPGAPRRLVAPKDTKGTNNAKDTDTRGTKGTNVDFAYFVTLT